MGYKQKRYRGDRNELKENDMEITPKRFYLKP